MTQSKSEPTKTPDTLVLDPQLEPIERYPSTPAIAQRNFQEYLAQKYSEGWVYNGTITNSVGSEANRPFWVFYRKSI